jgi:pimeloyl-ACP methyl ester carboxylesterase
MSSTAQDKNANQPSGTSPSAPPQQAESPFTEEPVVLETPTGKIFGTLELPRRGDSFPVALIISGSGPTDRNGNSRVLAGPNNSLKLLAQGLAERGVASVRYDKRGIGESINAATKESDLRFTTYIYDAAAWGEKLRGDKRFKSLTIVGHSEGSLIGMVAAYLMNADAYVSIAGSGRPAADILHEQMKSKLPPELLNQTDSILKSLTEGKTVYDTPQQLAALFRPSVQPYLISWFKYDPAKEIAKLSVPVLIAQGTTDLQVSVQDAKLLSQARPSAKLLIVDGMNHVLKDVPTDAQQQIKSYSDPSLPVDMKLIDAIAGMVNSTRKPAM